MSPSVLSPALEEETLQQPLNPGPGPLYQLNDVRKTYGSRTVLSIEELTVAPREVVALVGPSGAGKSTLLRLLNFLEEPTSGSIRFNGERVAGAPSLAVSRAITTVFQRPLLLDMSVRQNVAYGLRIRGRHDPHAVETALATVHMDALATAPARTLSGGEAQRAALARALVIEPRVLLLDEPTANLDPANVAIVEAAVRALYARGNTTVVLATHNLHQARRLASRAALLLDGRIVEEGPTADLLDRPGDPRTRAFVSGEMIY